MITKFATVTTTRGLINALLEIDPAGTAEVLGFAGTRHGVYVDMPDGLKEIAFSASDD